MSQYEAQALVIAREAVNANWAAVGVASLALVVAVVAGLVAYNTLQAMVTQLDTARWNSLLAFEQDMATRRSKFGEIAAQLDQAGAPTDLLRKSFDEAKESYFNSLDRLASSILRGHFADAEMKQDYRDVVATVVRGFPDDFNTGTPYRKVVKLYNRWEDGA